MSPAICVLFNLVILLKAYFIPISLYFNANGNST